MCIYSYMLKLHSPSKYAPFDAIHLLRLFSSSQKFLSSSILMSLHASARFCFTSSTLAKHFFEDFFHPRTQKESIWGWDQVHREGGAQGHAMFGQKLLNTQPGVGRCACESSIVKWANALKESSKKIPWSWTQPLTQCQLVHWCRWVLRIVT